MSTYEANWETENLVTAEAVFGIGSAMERSQQGGQELQVRSSARLEEQAAD